MLPVIRFCLFKAGVLFFVLVLCGCSISTSIKNEEAAVDKMALSSGGISTDEFIKKLNSMGYLCQNKKKTNESEEVFECRKYTGNDFSPRRCVFMVKIHSNIEHSKWFLERKTSWPASACVGF